MIRRLWAATIWAPGVVADGDSWRNAKRIWLPLFDVIMIISGINAIVFGSRLLDRLFRDPRPSRRVGALRQRVDGGQRGPFDRRAGEGHVGADSRVHQDPVDGMIGRLGSASDLTITIDDEG